MLVENYDENLAEAIRRKLSDKICEVAADATIALGDVGVYFSKLGLPELKECYFNVYSNNDINLDLITSLFDVKWNIASKKREFYRDKIKCEYEDKDALWYKLVDNEVFLHESVNWVMIKLGKKIGSIDYEFDGDVRYVTSEVNLKKFFYINFVLLTVNYSEELKNKILLTVQNIVRRFEPETYIQITNIENEREIPGTTELCFNLYVPINSSVNVKMIMDVIVARYEYFPPDEDDGHDESVWYDYSHGGLFLYKNVKGAVLFFMKDS